LHRLCKGTPSFPSHAPLNASRITNPPQQIADCVAGNELVEVVRLEAPSTQRHDRCCEDLAGGIHQSPIGRSILGNVQPKVGGALQECTQGVVMPTLVHPRLSAVEKLNKRPKFLRAILAGTELLSRYAGHIDNRNAISRFWPPRERAVDDTANPDCWPAPLFRAEGTELDQLRELLLDQWHRAGEVTVRIGPKNGRRRERTTRDTTARTNLLAEVLDDGGHFFSFAACDFAAVFTASV
jgi:hypothetical protein